MNILMNMEIGFLTTKKINEQEAKTMTNYEKAMELLKKGKQRNTIHIMIQV